MPRVSALIAALVLCVSSVAAGGAVSTANAAPTTEHAKYQRQAHNATNAQRDKRGIKAVRKQSCVQRFAVKHAKRMAAESRMFHQDLGPILKQCGLNSVGENVAYGYSTGRSVVNDGWMNSAGHRANILNSGYRVMGIGARQSSDGRWYVAQVFGRKA
jgi:uncharacterized protein YkwD